MATTAVAEKPSTATAPPRLLRSFAVKESSPPPPPQQQHYEQQQYHHSAADGNAGINIKEFLREALNRSAKDCNLLFKLEETIGAFLEGREGTAVDSEGRRSTPLPPMSSYGRMLAHRLAAYYGLEHNLDSSGQSVVLSYVEPRPQGPSEGLADLKQQPRILRRENGGKGRSLEGVRKGRSLEERQSEYYERRRRIFQQEDGEEGGEVGQPPWSHSSVTKRILKVNSLDPQPTASVAAKEPISKSYSFGGLGCAGGGGEPPNRRLTPKSQLGTSTCSSISPASSGYKSQSFELQPSTTSPSGTPPPPGSPKVAELSAQFQGTRISSLNVLWAVTDLASVPSGAVLIDPASGKPILNPDGSIYKFDSSNPPIIQYQAQVCPSPEYSPELSAPYLQVSNYPSQMLQIIQAPAQQHPMYQQPQQSPPQLLYPPPQPAPPLQFPIDIYNIRGALPPGYAPRFYNRYGSQQQVEQLLLQQLRDTAAEYTAPPMLVQQTPQHQHFTAVQHAAQQQGRRYWAPSQQQYYRR